MIASALIQQIYTAYKGKVASRTPAWGTDKSTMALEIANRLQRQWATDPYKKWVSLFEIKNVTPVIDASTFTYSLDASFLIPSDYIIVTKTDGSDVEIEITKPQKRIGNDTKVYLSGRNPKKLTFIGTTIDSTLVGGTIKVPAYYLPADMTASSSVVSVDDPNWLVYATAAELARNDASKQDQFPNLLGIANDLYSKMASANNDLGYGQDYQVPYDMPHIGDQSNDDWTV